MPFFGSSKPKAKTPEEAMTQMRDVRELLERKQLHLEKQIEQETEIARKNARTNKRQALLALKKKKKYEADLAKSDGILSNIDLMLDNLESQSMNTEVVKALSTGATTLKSQAKKHNVDNVDDMMYEIEEQMQQSEQINEALSRQIGYGATEIDESELEDELNELMQEDLDAQMLDIKSVPGDALPSVPTTSLPSAQEQDDDLDELRKFAEAA